MELKRYANPLEKSTWLHLLQLEMKKKRETQREKEATQTSAEVHILRSLNILIQ